MLSACAAAPRQAASHEFLDEQTGTTLSVVAKPLVFARERTDVAAHARDYATLVAVEVDNSGKYREYLLLYRWSTVDPRMSPAPDPHAGELRILADGRVIDLMPLEQMPVSLSRRRELHVPDHGDVIAHAYPVDSSTLRFIASSRELIGANAAGAARDTVQNVGGRANGACEVRRASSRTLVRRGLHSRADSMYFAMQSNRAGICTPFTAGNSGSGRRWRPRPRPMPSLHGSRRAPL